MRRAILAECSARSIEGSPGRWGSFRDAREYTDLAHDNLLRCDLNGQASGPIASFGYFRAIVDEVAQMDTSPEHWRYISESFEKYERAWLAQAAMAADGFHR